MSMSSQPPAAAAGTLAMGSANVNRMGFGARWVNYRGLEEGRALLLRAIELGIDLIDTADVYGAGASEELIAEALHPYPEGLVIATKGGQVSRDGDPTANGTPQHLRAACEDSLRRLRMDAIPLYQLHMPDPDVPIEESMGALADLRTEGKVVQVGVSNVRGPWVERAMAAGPVVSLQNQYNLRQRVSDPDVDRCAEDGWAFMPWAPLDGAVGDDPERTVARIADDRGATPAQVTLAWLLARSPAMVVIPGTSTVEHLEHNVAAASLELSEEDLAQLDALATAD